MKTLARFLLLLALAVPSLAATNAGRRTNGFWYVNTNVYLPEQVRLWNSNFSTIYANFVSTTNKINSLVLGGSGSNWVSIQVTNYAHIVNAPTSNSHAVRLLELSTTSNALVTLVATSSNGLITIINSKTNTLWGLLTNMIGSTSNALAGQPVPTNNPNQLAYAANGRLTIISNVLITNPIVAGEIKGTNGADTSNVRIVFGAGSATFHGGVAADTNRVMSAGYLGGNALLAPATNGGFLGSLVLRWKAHLTNSDGYFTNLVLSNLAGSGPVLGWSNNTVILTNPAAGSGFAVTNGAGLGYFGDGSLGITNNALITNLQVLGTTSNATLHIGTVVHLHGKPVYFGSSSAFEPTVARYDSIYSSPGTTNALVFSLDGGVVSSVLIFTNGMLRPLSEAVGAESDNGTITLGASFAPFTGLYLTNLIGTGPFLGLSNNTVIKTNADSYALQANLTTVSNLLNTASNVLTIVDGGKMGKTNDWSQGQVGSNLTASGFTNVSRAVDRVKPTNSTTIDFAQGNIFWVTNTANNTVFFLTNVFIGHTNDNQSVQIIVSNAGAHRYVFSNSVGVNSWIPVYWDAIDGTTNRITNRYTLNGSDWHLISRTGISNLLFGLTVTNMLFPPP